MEFAMQLISKENLVRGKTILELKDFNYQFLATQAKKGEQIVFLIASIKSLLI